MVKPMKYPMGSLIDAAMKQSLSDSNLMMVDEVSGLQRTIVCCYDVFFQKYDGNLPSDCRGNEHPLTPRNCQPASCATYSWGSCTFHHEWLSADCWKATQNMCASLWNSIEWYLEEHLIQQHRRLQKDP